ncbi:type IV toxin-antitoxin system AbiEi family antitoxin domain-containing protein [Cryobacterium psychrophilum]|uniref:Transcriptional regulator n=1 Tax=Cryobacterium psychrophilum TaxID=41988 RepID=A0A4Y8KY28_9MICO|nr:type IV toxin-antitoxin system AbiEi family antitoxin domain-containing protein [Cryobacterium psychrophilum]TDW26971.1 putative AbiEi antitoxin of type IV toxin-antitoxin system [Cryobacterium psychrophilum]TFD82028.1 transcriptional regulator [Cryobacterium psychrophilum]
MSIVVEPILEELAAGQWGLFTTAQAKARGVTRANLSHRERDGRLERLAHGVYRLGGVPVTSLDDLRAAWMSTEPNMLAWERVSTPQVVVGGAAAAAVHECGDIKPVPYRLITRERRQTQRTDISYSRRKLDSSDVVVLGGLPVTSIERTVADLVDEVGDLSLVGDVLADATRGERAVDLERLGLLLAPSAARYGHPRGDGAALLEQLRRSAGIDDVAAARALVQRPAIGAALEAIVSREVAEQLRTIVARLQPQLLGSAELREHIERMFTPALTEQSHLVSEIADTVLAPVLHRHREQMDQLAKTIAAQLSTPTRRRRTGQREGKEQ